MNYKKGIDISRWNVIEDYSRTAAEIDFAIVKATQGLAVSGTGYLFTDTKFAEHLNKLTNAGINCGGYHYLTAVTAEDAKREADYFCNVLDQHKGKIKLWAAVDVEEKSYLPLYNKTLLTEIVTVFCQVVERRGFRPLIYTNPDFLTNHMNNLLQYDLWLALWRNVNNLPSAEVYPNMKIWQYTGSGSIDGINGLVDMNLGFFDMNESEDEEMSYELWKEYHRRYEEELKKMKSDDWADDAAQWVTANKISDGTYPKMQVTRQETWTMLKRIYDKFMK